MRQSGKPDASPSKTKMDMTAREPASCGLLVMRKTIPTKRYWAELGAKTVSLRAMASQIPVATRTSRIAR